MKISLGKTNCSSNRHCHIHVTSLNFWGPTYISGTTEAAVIKFCRHVGHSMLVVSQCGRGQDHVTSWNFGN